MAAMIELGVATRRIFAIHDQPAYAGLAPPAVAAAHRAGRRRRLVLLPLFVGLTDDEQDEVVTALAKCL